ncbi:GTP cyclohydrolase, FolE2/MptA family [Desulfobulbus elongatus]|uniref:GTP cyclohydrolase, FolE2/MptA family n=1 Tax=Desulfobulbus elongatus TaxID=53332 RepID=UPI000688DADF|nr:GTP cyclohydrolase, FolE2/MptA family [Desulfobulbus elongatus]
MKDIQSRHDSRRINIRKVGVKSLSYPIIVLDRASATQQTLARVNMYVDLPHRFKGTHMSRFVEILNRFHGQFNIRTCHLILEEMKRRLEAESAHLELAFPFFLAAGAAEQEPGMARYDCRLHGTLARTFDLVVEVDVPVPLADRPGPEHVPAPAGMWGSVTASVRMKRFLWIEDLIALIRQETSPQAARAETVEFLCRRIDDVLRATGSFHWYKVVVKNIGSGYSTFASSEWPEPAPDRTAGREGVWRSGGASEAAGPFMSNNPPRTDCNE